VVADVAKWITHNKRRGGKAPSTLRGYAAGLGRWCDFWNFTQSENSETPINDFFETLVHGSERLGWENVAVSTAKRIVEILYLFLDWYTEESGLEHPNPKIEEELSWGAKMAERARRYKSDVLYHLFNTTKSSRKRGVRKYLPSVRADRGAAPKIKRPDKQFSFDDFIILVEHETSPRDRMIWLLLGAGGLRESETGHLFLSDISCDVSSSEANVLLVDPAYGKVSAGNTATRQKYLETKYGLVPRNQLPYLSTGFAGWKGMRFQDHQSAGVTWLHPHFGRKQEAHLEYLSQRNDVPAQHHPWYLVNLKHNIGEPISLKNIAALLKSACQRLSLASPPNPHALRHMYVNVLVNELELQLHEAQVLVRHRSPESTEAYSTLSREVVRKSLESLSARLRVSPKEEWNGGTTNAQ
jgi:integrase